MGCFRSGLVGGFGEGGREGWLERETRVDENKANPHPLRTIKVLRRAKSQQLQGVGGEVRHNHFTDNDVEQPLFQNAGPRRLPSRRATGRELEYTLGG